MSKLKNRIFTCALATACGYSIFQKLQRPAVLSLALLAALLYKQYTRALVESLLGFVNGAKVAKFGQLEFQTVRKSIDVSSMTLKEMMLSELTPRDVSLLLTVYQMRRWAPLEGTRDRLRELRNRGWLAHDKPALSGSSEVWLTPAGEAVARSISPGLESNGELVLNCVN